MDPNCGSKSTERSAAQEKKKDRITPHVNNVFGHPTVEKVNKTKTKNNPERRKTKRGISRNEAEGVRLLHLPMFDDVV